MGPRVFSMLLLRRPLLGACCGLLLRTLFGLHALLLRLLLFTLMGLGFSLGALLSGLCGLRLGLGMLFSLPSLRLGLSVLLLLLLLALLRLGLLLGVQLLLVLTRLGLGLGSLPGSLLLRAQVLLLSGNRSGRLRLVDLACTGLCWLRQLVMVGAGLRQGGRSV